MFSAPSYSTFNTTKHPVHKYVCHNLSTKVDCQLISSTELLLYDVNDPIQKIDISV